MAKFYGIVGYVIPQETSPGVWEETVIESYYYGDVLKNSRRWERGEGLNNDIVLSNSISVIADEYSLNNLSAIRYVKWMDSAWEVTNVDVDLPRLTLTIGGVYNGNQTPAAFSS